MVFLGIMLGLWPNPFKTEDETKYPDNLFPNKFPWTPLVCPKIRFPTIPHPSASHTTRPFKPTFYFEVSLMKKERVLLMISSNKINKDLHILFSTRFSSTHFWKSKGLCPYFKSFMYKLTWGLRKRLKAFSSYPKSNRLYSCEEGRWRETKSIWKDKNGWT